MTERTIIEPSKGWKSIRIKDLFIYRELLYFLAWRDIKVRYKQTFLGVIWILFQPFATMIIFTFIFHKLANIQSGKIPYSLFTLAGILPWNYFSSSMNRATSSLVGSAHLISKVYFPRLIIPMGAVFTGWIDFGIALFLLGGMMAVYRVSPGIQALSIPFFLFLAMLVALGMGLWLSVLNVRYRDVGFLTPFLSQFWMFLTPVIYPTELVPESVQWLYELNPMVGVVEGFRWALFGTPLPIDALAISFIIAMLLFLSGAFFFQRMERTLADVI